MLEVPRLIPVLLLCALLAACSGGDAATPTPTPRREATVPPRATVAAGATRPAAAGSIELSGGVRGFLSVLAVSCPRSGAGAEIAIKGRIENRLFDLDITAPGPGSYQVGAAAGVSVALKSQTPDDRSVNRWGGSETPGTGHLTLDTGLSGTIDATLSASSGGPAVSLRGSWNCPA
jgi:hypothetical protein